MKDLKESNSIEVAEFYKARGIAEEPDFAWGVPYTMQKRDIILSVIKSRICKSTHKYGIDIPTSIDHVHGLDKENGNNFWRDANATKMHSPGVEFIVLPEVQNPPVRWSNVTGHLIRDVKMDFYRKTRWVLDGKKT